MKICSSFLHHPDTAEFMVFNLRVREPVLVFFCEWELGSPLVINHTRLCPRIGRGWVNS